MLGYSGYRELGEFAKNNRHRLSKEFKIEVTKLAAPDNKPVDLAKPYIENNAILRVHKLRSHYVLDPIHSFCG